MWTEMITEFRSSKATRAAAEAMAKEMQRLARQLVSHPGRAAEGMPPGLESGHLRAEIKISRVTGDDPATAQVGSFSEYAAVQEFGGDIWPSHKKFLHWVDDRGPAYHKMVHIKKHPYMRTARSIGIRTGLFSKVGMAAFMTRLPWR